MGRAGRGRGDEPEPLAPVAAADVEAVFRAEAGRALATVARMAGDLGLAEDAVQDAFAVAVRTWPTAGVPARPGAWITTVARNRALDHLRREARRHQRELDAVAAVPEPGEPLIHPVRDDQLLLMLTCCHPALGQDTQVALTLRFVAGLRTSEVARLLLLPEATVTKRLQRAKAKIRANAIGLRVPPPDQLGDRIAGACACTYLIFTEGYAASGGDVLIRTELCDEAVRLACLTVGLLPDEPGPRALLALLLLQDSRRDARLDGSGDIVLLEDQDRDRWDHERIREAVDHLAELDRQAAATGEGLPAWAAAYRLQAEIAGVHATAPTWEATDWPRLVAIYQRLAAVAPSPVVELNRAVALVHAAGPQAGLAALDRLAGDARLARSHLLPAARADALARLGRTADAAEQLGAALAAARTGPERRLLRRRLQSLAARAELPDGHRREPPEIGGSPGC